MKRLRKTHAGMALALVALESISLLAPVESAQAWIGQPRCTTSMLESVDNYPPPVSCNDLNSQQAIKDAMYDIADACVLSILNSFSDQVNSVIVLMEDVVFAPDKISRERVVSTMYSTEDVVGKIADAVVSFAKGSIAHVQSCAGEGIAATLERNLRTFKSFSDVVKAAGALQTDLSKINVVSDPKGTYVNFDDITLVKELKSKLTNLSQHVENLASDVETVSFALLGEEFEDEVNLRRSKKALSVAMGAVSDPGTIDSPGDCRLEELDSSIRDAQQALVKHRWFSLTRAEHYAKSRICIAEDKYPAPSLTDWQVGRIKEMNILFKAEVKSTRDLMMQIDQACRQLEDAIPPVRERGDVLNARIDQAVRDAVSCDIKAARGELAAVHEALKQSQCLVESPLASAFYNAEQKIRVAMDVCSGTMLVDDDDIHINNTLPATVDPDRYYWYVIRKKSSGIWHWKNYRCDLTHYEPVQFVPRYLDEEISRRRAQWNEQNLKCQAQGCERSAGFSRIWRPDSWSFDIVMGPLESLSREETPTNEKNCTGSMTN